MADVNPIALAIPAFFVAIIIEAGVSWWRGMRVYRLNDALADLGCGMTSQVLGIFYKTAVAYGYLVLAEHASVFTMPADALWTWLIAVIGVDFFYYWWHRFTHEVNIGWASHVVHHQSEEYNLAVALRQSTTSTLTSWPFYLPLAILGVPPVVAATAIALNTLYQFWIHTELIRSCGPLEWVLNTPSHHRVHHGINPRYLDKNYAGMFIVWDRMFGTFEPESEPAVYGTVKPLRSLNVAWANIAVLAEMVADSRAANTWTDRAMIWLGHPGYRAAGLPGFSKAGSVSPEQQIKHDPQVSPWLVAYMLAQFIPAAGCTMLALLNDSSGDWLLLALLAAQVVLVTTAWGALFERRRWGALVEAARLVITPIAASVVQPTMTWWVVLYAGLSLMFLFAALRAR